MLIAHKEPIRDTWYVLGFGRWKGHSIKDVMLEDPQYIIWLSESGTLDIHSDIIDEIETSFIDAAMNAKLR